MVKTNQTSEEKILAAAREVFHQRGFDGARMQEIADKAGINKSLIHYYYRNKENLFNAVFTEAFATMTGAITSIFEGTGTMEEKLSRFFDFHISFLQENSFLPRFILTSLYQKPDQIRDLISKVPLHPNNILTQVMEALKKEGVVVKDPLQMFANILSLSIFPVIAQPMFGHIFKLTDKEMKHFYEVRKKNLGHFVIHGMNLQKLS